MALNDTPVFRKIIVPWYDSECACLLTILFMDLVFLFGVTGIAVVHETEEYKEHMWVPALLAALSLSVILSVLIRVCARWIHRLKYDA